MPVFAIFFPVEIAIALTAIVHLLNNLFKATLIWKHIDFKTVALFAIPAALMALVGALLLSVLSTDIVLFSYHVGESLFVVTLVKFVIALLLVVFAVIEIDRRFEKFSFSRKFLPLGGSLSGFFGGLSGHQGALRSMFLLRAGLTKEGFIATSIASAVLIDVSRLSVYGLSFFSRHFESVSGDSAFYMVVTACLGAFVGSFFGRKVLRKITMRSVQLIVGVMIIVLAVLLGTGFI